ncbi:hypothetical protein DO97_18625 [Neosynechococcus sphagnicola sy1]|uniref:Uncharacterized protein n=1 Tax=Neosynechococcus sphagnicola sy1 TaxID=1497020 RepID=A0A098TMI6_9CYAN|nr:hypothetical protein [Neosynechococcus sphagnicola]KGF73519.1 hypothetical protein DO97_18625 [Neosynechococcus sphagnicola sy1]
MSTPTPVRIPKDIFAGLKYMERTKAIPYIELRDCQAVIQQAEQLHLFKLAHWIGTHPTEYTTGTQMKSFQVQD